MALTLGDIARFVGGRLVDTSSRDVPVDWLGAPAHADHRTLSFALGPSRAAPPEPRVAGWLRAGGDADDDHRPGTILVADLALTCARAAAWLPLRKPDQTASTSIHATASVASSARIGAGSAIGEQSVVAAGVSLGAGVRVGSYSRIDHGAVIGDGVILGNRVRIGTGAVIGEDGFSFVRDGARWLRVPAFGSVVIGDDVEILALAVVHAGVFSDTSIGAGCVLDSHVLIGHDAKVGAGSAIAGHAAVAGAASIGRDCRIGGKAAVGEGVAIADGVTVAAMSMVRRSILERDCSYAGGWPAQPARAWWRLVAGAQRRSSRHDEHRPGAPRDGGR